MRFFGHVAEAGFVLEQAIAHVDAVNTDAPARRLEQPGQDRHRRRLAGAVRPQQSQNGAGRERETDIADGRDGRVRTW